MTSPEFSLPLVDTVTTTSWVPEIDRESWFHWAEGVIVLKVTEPGMEGVRTGRYHWSGILTEILPPPVMVEEPTVKRMFTVTWELTGTSVRTLFPLTSRSWTVPWPSVAKADGALAAE